MKGFFKNVLATITGIIIITVLGIIILSVVMLGVYSSSKYKLKDDTILFLNLTGTLKDKTEDNPLLEYLGLKEAEEIALSDMRSAIKKAKENDKIKGIYIQAGFLSTSHALLLELRDELKDFKESGKFIIAYGDTYTQGSYYLSSVADKVVLNPQGNVHIYGLASFRVFYKGLLDKIGVDMQVFKVGTYKSAVEPYMLDKMSEANKEQVSSYIQDIWEKMCRDMSESRNISVDEFNLIADSSALFSLPQQLVSKNIVDTLMYETDVKKYLTSLTGKEKVSDLRLATVSNMASVDFKEKNNSKERIAILYAEGSISSGKGSTNIQDKFYVKQLEKLKDDDKVKAVVFRVNSGGGSAYASEQIWKAVADLKEKKPVVVSMGGYAASGGYYIAANASRIIAQPSTLTGSIGIFGIFPNVEGLTKKIGINYDNVKTNRLGDFGDFSRPMRDEERALLQGHIDRGYDLFITRCAEGRNIPKDSINKIAQGRVWTGNQALKIGLVDELGGIDKAIEVAAELANLQDYSVKQYPPRKNFWEELISNKKEELALRAIKEYIGEDYGIFTTIKEIKNLKEQDFIQARLPYDFPIE